MLVGMVTWPGERQSKREEGEGTFVSGEEPISSSAAAGCSVSSLPSVLLWRKRTLQIKDASAVCFYLSEPHFLTYIGSYYYEQWYYILMAKGIQRHRSIHGNPECVNHVKMSHCLI